ncbi:MAG: BatA and WFA domain-containing protein [Planctomycetaceae bacterium]|nr:BatA and WFA domain-containing protein [Planctomycetaceae bacterium]
MTWPGFAALSSAWLFALLGPLIIFYFLKLRRPRLEIPSLALWQQVISDQRVNSPFQRFKRNLLLLLQILLLCALALAAMQPFWPAGSDTAKSIPVLIDCSASMAALDEPGGKTRLDVAKEEVARLIDNLLPDQRLCLIAVDSTARRLTDFTDNQRVLHDALKQLEVHPVPSRLEDGLRMAQALARTADVQNVVFLSDGNVPATIEFQLPFRLNYQKLPPAGPNVGITDFNARRTKSGWDVFARMEGSGAKLADAAETTEEDSGLVEVELLQNGEPLKRESVGITAGQVSRVSFPIETETAASLELRIKPDRFDSLASDNTAYLELPAPRNLQVYCSDELASYRHALDVTEGIDLFPKEGAAEPELVDLKFTDSTLEAGPKGRVTIHVGVIPTDVQALVGIEQQLVEVVDWNRTAPLLRHVQLLDVQIADDPVSKSGIGERDYELAGYEILAQGARGPLILEKPSETGVDYFLLFHSDRSSLPYRVGFPILVANCVQIAMDRSALAEARSWPTGNLPPQRLTAGTEYTIDGPDGSKETVQASATGIVSGATASAAGRYVIRSGDEPVVSLGVSLLAPAESALVSVDKLQFPETSVSTATETIATDRPLWGWFAVAGLMLLLGEWWCFQRRPGGVPV